MKSRSRHAAGFTLIELVAVIAVIGLLSGLVVWRMGSFVFWREQSFLRRISETVYFLHHQAVFDQSYYALEINLENPKQHTYSVGIFNAADLSSTSSALSDPIDSAGGLLSLELSFFLNPSLPSASTFIPPPTFPSLADPVKLPEGMLFEDVRTMSGKHLASEAGRVYIMFSPRGFSEFAVLHLRNSTGQPLTILVNPFSGTTELFNEYKDFQWAYGKKKRSR